MSDDAPTKEETLQSLRNFIEILEIDGIEPTFIRRSTDSDGWSIIEVHVKGPGVMDIPEEALS